MHSIDELQRSLVQLEAVDRESFYGLRTLKPYLEEIGFSYEKAGSQDEVPITRYLAYTLRQKNLNATWRHYPPPLARKECDVVIECDDGQLWCEYKVVYSRYKDGNENWAFPKSGYNMRQAKGLLNDYHQKLSTLNSGNAARCAIVLLCFHDEVCRIDETALLSTINGSLGIGFNYILCAWENKYPYLDICKFYNTAHVWHKPVV
jgi:hypothetical protein